MCQYLLYLVFNFNTHSYRLSCYLIAFVNMDVKYRIKEFAFLYVTPKKGILFPFFSHNILGLWISINMVWYPSISFRKLPAKCDVTTSLMRVFQNCVMTFFQLFSALAPRTKLPSGEKVTRTSMALSW